MTAEWIVKAVEAVRSGLAQKLEKDGVTVYACGKIVRIDIKDTAKLGVVKGVEKAEEIIRRKILRKRGEAAPDTDDLPWD